MVAAPMLLLIEDEMIIRDVLEIDLKEAGYEVVATGSGKETLAKLDGNANHFQAVITDIRMGDGPDGWNIGRRARELVSDMPIVYMSGDRSKEWSSKGVPHSVMLAKPFAAAQLITAVSTLLNLTKSHSKPSSFMGLWRHGA